MIAIIDYGAGNLQSVEKALRHIGCPCQVADSPAMAALEQRGLDRAIREFVDSGRPFLGICLGLQVLFESSEESPGVKGLGLLPGKILRLPGDRGLKIPHIGWNSLEVGTPGWLLKGLEPEPYVYFVHSYYLQAQGDVVTSTAQYGCQIHAAVEQGNLAACQFHPEKSGSTGLGNFAEKAKAQQRRD